MDLKRQFSCEARAENLIRSLALESYSEERLLELEQDGYSREEALFILDLVTKGLRDYDLPDYLKVAVWKCAVCNKAVVKYGTNCKGCKQKESSLEKGLGISEISNE